ncbi:type II CAAX prenyl endopeptidase Rce1 family protein [Kitasatospora sp. NPDC088134]|uniref:CPBP family glutamic-type intramembrane protease n=1 Tax=Kitasatospora sp. NPDC088134 TaxID=3364071 RepID=UPI00380C92D5
MTSTTTLGHPAHHAVQQWLPAWALLAACAYSAQALDLAHRVTGGRGISAHTFTAAECAGVVTAGLAPILLRTTRTDARPGRTAFAATTAMLVLARLSLALPAAGPAETVDVLRLLLGPAVIVLLAAELLARAGAPMPRPARPTWSAVSSTPGPTVLYTVALFLAFAVSQFIAQFTAATDQGAALEVTRTAALTLAVQTASNAALEEFVFTGVLCTLGTALRVPVPWMIAAAAVGRLLLHAYLGPAALGAAVVAAASIGIYLLNRSRLLPLVLAHTAFNALMFYGMR